MEQPQQQQHLPHFSDSKHPLVFYPDSRYGGTCCGCQESVYGPSYYCREGGLQHWIDTTHHKSCAELPLGLHHPLHPIHPLILFDENTYYYPEEEEEEEDDDEEDDEEDDDEEDDEEDKEKTKCQVCNESRRQYTYRCYRCDFNLHATCASLPPTIQSSQVHHHPLTPFWKWMSFTCDLCAKEVKGIPNLCALCSYCVQELKEENEDPELDQSVNLVAYKVKNIKLGEDGTKIATEIQHFSHEHGLKLSDDEVLNIEKCDRCVQAIFPPFYSCLNCNFFLHESCAKLPRKKRHPLHQHSLTLFLKSPYLSKTFKCDACKRYCNGFIYDCDTCWFSLDVSCSLISDTLTHHGHEHRLLLSSIESEHNCSCCDSKISPIFRCTTCEFALHFKCATLPLTARYKQHKHPFTLCYTTEDDSGEYYCDICENERDSRHWFYYCANCSYPSHTKCILGEDPNLK